MVLYFGLGIAYFVNESGTVSGYGRPTSSGWKWNLEETKLQEVTTGLQMMNNRAMPRFLELPFPVPSIVNR